jgi:hypothetical protein
MNKSRIEEKLQNIRNSISNDNTPVKNGSSNFISKNLKDELESYKKDIFKQNNNN